MQRALCCLLLGLSLSSGAAAQSTLTVSARGGPDRTRGPSREPSSGPRAVRVSA